MCILGDCQIFVTVTRMEVCVLDEGGIGGCNGGMGCRIGGIACWEKVLGPRWLEVMTVLSSDGRVDAEIVTEIVHLIVEEGLSVSLDRSWDNRGNG